MFSTHINYYTCFEKNKIFLDLNCACPWRKKDNAQTHTRLRKEAVGNKTSTRTMIFLTLLEKNVPTLKINFLIDVHVALGS